MQRENIRRILSTIIAGTALAYLPVAFAGTLLIENVTLIDGTGRPPIAQPPGSETRACPVRARSGPSTRNEARIFRTRSIPATIFGVQRSLLYLPLGTDLNVIVRGFSQRTIAESYNLNLCKL